MENTTGPDAPKASFSSNGLAGGGTYPRGQWDFVEEDDGEDGYYHAVIGTMLDRTGVILDSLNRDHLIDPEEDRANVRLAATAPDGLALAREIVRALSTSTGREVRNSTRHEMEPIRQMALLLIAKATGKPANI